MISNNQTYELTRKFDANGKSYGLFYHAKSRRNSLWIHESVEWNRIADVYNVAEFFKLVTRLQSSPKRNFVWLAVSVLISVVAVFAFINIAS
jgi:hypothetical protein